MELHVLQSIPVTDLHLTVSMCVCVRFVNIRTLTQTHIFSIVLEADFYFYWNYDEK